ncbi:hypothetical protein HY439_03850 [Candidatus Microgenomates bacterium]|nr:hypothetical protein [Candidatus Microgenomates bacterium]
MAVLRIKETFVWFIILIAGLIFGQILTVDPPNGSRALVFLPVIFLFSAIALEKILSLTGKHRLFLAAFIIINLALAYADFSYYQNWMTWIKM